MSTIQPINYQNQPKLAKQNANYASAQSFGLNWLKPKAMGDYAKLGLTGDEIEIAKTCEGKIVGAGTRLAEFLSRNESEVEKQLINAAFTSTLAPLVIGWNPFSKQDEETKKYMAVRQPISAVVAIAGGIALTMPIESWFARRCSMGGNQWLDLRMAPDKSYLKKQVKKENPGIKGKALATKIEEKQKEVKNFFANLISEEPENISIDNGKVKIDVTDGKPLVMEIPNIIDKPQLDAYLEKHSLHKRSFRDFLKETIGLELFDDGEIKPGAWKETENNVSAMDFLRKIGIAGKATQVGEKCFDEDHLRKTLGLYRQEKTTIPEVEREAGKGAFKNTKGVVQAIIKETVRNDQMMKGKDFADETATLGQLFFRLQLQDQDDRLNQLMKLNIADALDELAEPLRIHKISGFKLTADVKDFAKNIIENKSEILTKRFKVYKDFFSIGSNLLIVAATCTALNWIYPRFVETFLPNLVKSDKKPQDVKGGNK